MTADRDIDRMTIDLALLLQEQWGQEIEQAIDKAKRSKRTRRDTWFRREFYRAEWRRRNERGPRITRD